MAVKKKSKVVKPKTSGATFVNFVLDQTGSMVECWNETISGFNEYIQTLKKQSGKCLFSLTLFDSERIEVRYKAVSPDKVKPLTKKTYIPGCMTPLYDAIATTIRATEKEIKKTKPAPAVICVVMTDGFENASKEHTVASIKKLIRSKEKDGKWNFIYLGANQDAWAVGATIGMHKGNTQSYHVSNTARAVGMAALATAHYVNTSGGEASLSVNLVSNTIKRNKKYKGLDTPSN